MDNIKLDIKIKTIADVNKAHSVIAEVLKIYNCDSVKVSGRVSTKRGVIPSSSKATPINSIDEFNLAILNRSDFYAYKIKIEGYIYKNNGDGIGYILVKLNKIAGASAEITCDSNNPTKQLEFIDNVKQQYNNTDKQELQADPIANLVAASQPSTTSKKHDVFVSHASEDKDEYVRELVASLKRVAPDVWYDEDSMEWGDNLLSKITSGLETSEFAIVVFSKSFFGKTWTEFELKELLNKQNSLGVKVVLPLLYNCTTDEFFQKYPFLRDLIFMEANKLSCDDIAMKFAKILIKRLKGER
ncbi:MAG: toll/interleukin-1 receptor domain-containing protein [Rikenellaceae bacterium]